MFINILSRFIKLDGQQELIFQYNIWLNFSLGHEKTVNVRKKIKKQRERYREGGHMHSLNLPLIMRIN